MVKGKNTGGMYTPRKKGKGKYAKTKESNNKSSRNYKKVYNAQGR